MRALRFAIAFISFGEVAAFVTRRPGSAAEREAEWRLHEKVAVAPPKNATVSGVVRVETDSSRPAQSAEDLIAEEDSAPLIAANTSHDTRWTRYKKFSRRFVK